MVLCTNTLTLGAALRIDMDTDTNRWIDSFGVKY